MAITLGTSFLRTSAEPIDNSQVLSKAEMIAINDDLMPEKYFAVCKDDGKLYTYDKSATPNGVTGKFTIASGDGTSDFNDLTNRPKYLGDAMTNKTDVMGFELIEDHDGCYWYDDAYTWMGAWKKTPGGGATGHGMVVSRGQREIGLIKGDAGGSSSQRWRIPMADKVEDMLAEKADKATTYTKTETDGKIAEAMTDVDNEHFHPVTVLPDPQDEDPTKRPRENHEYILIEYEQDGTTIKGETHYLFYGGEYHQKSTGGISLDGYATEDFVNTKTAKMGEFDVTPIPYGPTGAHEINATVSNKDNENARVSYVRQSDGTLPSTVNLGVKSGLGEDTFELPTKALVDTKQDALTTGQGARIRGNVIDTPLLDEIPAIGNRSSFYDDHFYESVKQSNTVYTAKYKSAEDRQVVYNADLTDYYWRVKYENNTEEFIELRNRRITQAGGTTDVVRYDTYKIFTNEPYKHVTPDIMWIDIVQNAEAQYVFGTYGKSYTAEQMGHPRAMSMTPYAKTMIKKLSDIVKTDLFLQGIIEEKGSSWGVAKAGKVRFVFASPTTTICDLNIDISELGLTSTNDYVIQMTISGGGKMDWGASELWTWGGSATSIGVTCRNDINKNNDFVDVDYVIVAKGFGGGSGGSGGGTVDQTYDATSTNAQSGTAVAEALASKALSPTGWGVVRTGVATVEFNNSKWSSSATVDVSDLGFSSGADYDVVAQPTTGGTAAPWGNAVAFVNANKGASSFSVSSVTMEESLNGTVNVKYTIFAKGYGAVAYTGEIPTGGTTGQILTKRSDADGDYGWETGGGSGTVDTAMSDTSENAVQNKVIKAYVDDADAELQKHKATGYFERTDYPITLDTVGQRSYALARDVFTVEIESHKPYTYEFTASDVYDLTRYVETTGKTFVAMNEDNETIYITMNGALPDNVQYVAGSTNPVVDLTNATVTLTKTTFLQQIDDMLIPRTSGEVFVFDVDSDQFTEDPENPGGKHNGMTIDSPTFDEIMDNLVAGKIVFVRMTFNGGNSYDFYQLSRESQQGIRGKAFDLEFPQGHIWFYDIYIKKRGIGTNATTYFGVFADKVVDGGGGTVDAYTKEETNALLGEKASLNIAAIHGGGGGDEISATVSQGTDSVNVNYYKDSEPPNSLNLNIGEDSFRVPTTDYVDGAVGDLTMLTTTNKSSAVAAINEIDFAVKGLGEPFRVKQWGSNTLNVEIPYCTEDIANASIPKMVYSIDDVEGADYQIVGMLAYEVFDAASGGNRINCFPVCQFTGNGQKELSVRWACMGTTRKTAKRINAWVLLKHR